MFQDHHCVTLKVFSTAEALTVSPQSEFSVLCCPLLINFSNRRLNVKMLLCPPSACIENMFHCVNKTKTLTERLKHLTEKILGVSSTYDGYCKYSKKNTTLKVFVLH